MKKILSIIVLAFFVCFTTASAQNNIASVEPISGFKQVTIPTDVKSSIVFNSGSKAFTKQIITQNGTQFLLCLDSKGKIVYAGYQGSNSGVFQTNSIRGYIGCIHTAYSDSQIIYCRVHHLDNGGWKNWN